MLCFCNSAVCTQTAASVMSHSGRAEACARAKTCTRARQAQTETSQKLTDRPTWELVTHSPAYLAHSDNVSKASTSMALGVYTAGPDRSYMGRTPPTLYWNTGRCCRMWCFTALTSVVRTCTSTSNPN